MKTLTALLALITIGCTGRTFTAPTPPVTSPEVTVIQYAINIPSGAQTTILTGQYPHGVELCPVDAQATFNFTATYGTPNVYYGVQAPPLGSYNNVGIVVAPLAAASRYEFTNAEYPGICPNTCRWLGHLETAIPGFRP